MLKSIPSQIHLYLIGMSVFKNINTETGAKRLVGGEKQYLASHPLFFWILNDVICSHRSSLLSWISMEPSCCFFSNSDHKSVRGYLCILSGSSSSLISTPLLFFSSAGQIQQIRDCTNSPKHRLKNLCLTPFQHALLPFQPARLHFTQACFVLFWFFLKEGTTKRERPF